MVFFESVNALLNLNPQYIIDIIMGNLVWVAMFYAIICLLYDDKRTVYYFLLLGIYLWAFLDFVGITGLGWALIGGALWIVLRIIIFEAAESTPLLKKYLFQVWTIVSFGLLIYVAFFSR